MDVDEEEESFVDVGPDFGRASGGGEPGRRRYADVSHGC